MRRLFAFPLLCLILAGLTGPAFASGDIGFRGGLAVNPDEFVVGLHFRTDPLDGKQLYLVPSFEAGFGDATMLAFNGDLHYVFDLESKLDPYVGGGITINWFDDNGASDTQVGGSILGGLLLGQTDMGRMFLEMKIGLGDVPDAKMMVGWNLR